MKHWAYNSGTGADIKKGVVGINEKSTGSNEGIHIDPCVGENLPKDEYY